MPRGGYRKNAGRKKKWKSGTTTSIRVPVALADQILELAHIIDEGESLDYVANSNTIDVTGIRMSFKRNDIQASLLDLMRAGYEIYPLDVAEKLRNILKNRGMLS